jgi:hypothetical protein
MAFLGYAPLFPIILNHFEGYLVSMNRAVNDSILFHLKASFSKPESLVWRFERLESDHHQLLCYMDFQVMTYAIHFGTFKSVGSEQRPIGRLYNDGPNIRLEVLSVRYLVMYMLSDANMSSFALCLGVRIFRHRSSRRDSEGLRISGRLLFLLHIVACTFRRPQTSST